MVEKKQGVYSQAIESTVSLQTSQLYQDLQPHLHISFVPKTWSEFFSLLEANPQIHTLCDEFPYLVQSDASLPSLLQKWLDHRKKKTTVSFYVDLVTT